MQWPRATLPDQKKIEKVSLLEKNLGELISHYVV